MMFREEREKKKPFLIIETVPVGPERHVSSGVTWHWLRDPDARSQGTHCTCTPWKARPAADEEVLCYQPECGKSFLRLQGDGILGWEIRTLSQSWVVPADWVTWAL